MLGKLWRGLVKAVAGGVIQELAAVEAKKITHDVEGWSTLYRERETEDRLYVEWAEDVKDALEAWRRNFLVRQIVRLTTNYVVGDGIGISSEIPTVEKFVRDWWSHPMNRMDLRLGAMCDELTRSGELFPVLFRNQFDGMTYVRFIPARWIDKIETDPEDLERELGYHRLGTVNEVQGKWWFSPETAAFDEPVCLHYAVNRAIGCVRGESDLLPILPWAKRYSEWVKDRVRLNKARTESGLWDVTIDDDTKVMDKKKEYGSSPPPFGSMMIHGKGESWKAESLKIDAHIARDDGKVLRLAVATGAGVPLHFLSEGESATRATAAEMGDPTFRHFSTRQKYFCWVLMDLIGQAYRMAGKRYYSDLKLKVTVPDIVAKDNQAMAESAKTIVEALAMMRDRGWVTDEMAIGLAFKFAGEILAQEEIERILSEGASKRVSEPVGEEGGLVSIDVPVLAGLIRGGDGDGSGQ